MDKNEGYMDRVDQAAGALASPLQVDITARPGYQEARAQAWGTAQNRLDLKLLSPSLTDAERHRNLAIYTDWAVSP